MEFKDEKVRYKVWLYVERKLWGVISNSNEFDTSKLNLRHISRVFTVRSLINYNFKDQSLKSLKILYSGSKVKLLHKFKHSI